MFKGIKPLDLLYWAITGIVVFLFIFLFVKLSPIFGDFFSFLWYLLSPFLIAILIAYLVYPVIKKMHHFNIPKSIAILIIYLLFFGGTAYLIYRVYPAIIHQLSDLNKQLPHLIEMYRNFVYSLYEYTAFLPETVHDKMDELIYDIESFIENLLTNLVRGFTKVFDLIVFLTVIPVLVFYFLKDFVKIKNYFKKWVPSKYQTQVGDLVQAVDKSLGKYIRGQLLVCLFVAFTTFAAFYILDVKYALLLAIIIGLTNIIPYFGPIIGAVPAVAITAAASGKLVLMVLLTIFIIQLIEGNLLSPYIVGKSINIHPIAIIFALLLGGQLSGVLGMILAVPVLTIMNVVTTHLIAIKRYN
ncbi:Predicted PurR-regulated permease PerM [Virgibacillus subterraneus]|uniref:Predicted PurR-regulated permease PerM n=2 Tax=Virgibacillus TaxID=84406 RepID=A0A1H1B663_9BACI|nr:MULTISPECIES: AI-2E family transporter [Virgibacillus]SDQ47417.1 Predicted PurR-regulated permease PerM [Virgibacillus salinus]SEQ16069.1 Predicted PurR-regulated permease PerM [Virgibacillus subterraneus]